MANRRKKAKKPEVRILGDDLFPWPWWRSAAGPRDKAERPSRDATTVWPKATQDGIVLSADPAACLLTIIIDVKSDYAMTVVERPIFAYLVTSPSKGGEPSDAVVPVCSTGPVLYRELRQTDDATKEILSFVWTGRRWDPRWATINAKSSTDWCSYSKGRRAIEDEADEAVRGFYGEDESK